MKKCIKISYSLSKIEWESLSEKILQYYNIKGPFEGNCVETYKIFKKGNAPKEPIGILEKPKYNSNNDIILNLKGRNRIKRDRLEIILDRFLS